MAPRAMILYASPMGQSHSLGGLPAYRILRSLAPSLGRVAPREPDPHAAAFPHRIEHMKEGRRRGVYRELPSVQRVERSQTQCADSEPELRDDSSCSRVDDVKSNTTRSSRYPSATSWHVHYYYYEENVYGFLIFGARRWTGLL
jgi:hypothetical protein